MLTANTTNPGPNSPERLSAWRSFVEILFKVSPGTVFGILEGEAADSQKESLEQWEKLFELAHDQYVNFKTLEAKWTTFREWTPIAQRVRAEMKDHEFHCTVLRILVKLVVAIATGTGEAKKAVMEM